MSIKHNIVDISKFNKAAQLPYELRRQDFQRESCIDHDS